MIGYAILTRNDDGLAWQMDWDGEIHPTRAEAEEELRLCQEANVGTCRLVMIVGAEYATAAAE